MDDLVPPPDGVRGGANATVPEMEQEAAPGTPGTMEKMPVTWADLTVPFLVHSERSVEGTPSFSEATPGNDPVAFPSSTSVGAIRPLESLSLPRHLISPESDAPF